MSVTNNQQGENQPKPKSKRGFAAMSAEQRRAIAGKGGKAAHKKGTAYKFNSETARLAGRVGGKSVSEDRDHMAEIGRRGGEASSIKKGYKLIRLDIQDN
jgi:general stress protein YciG